MLPKQLSVSFSSSLNVLILSLSKWVSTENTIPLQLSQVETLVFCLFAFSLLMYLIQILVEGYAEQTILLTTDYH